MSIRFSLSLAIGLVFSSHCWGQELPDYPAENLTDTYQVDSSWPEKPGDFVWEAMSGIAVDSKDQVWTFNRSTPPVQVYSKEGKFLKAWGEQVIGKAHHLRIDSKGNIWVADIDNHIVIQLTPEGKVLRELGIRGEKGADERHLNMPTDMAITDKGEVFVADGYGNNRVVHFNDKGEYVSEWGTMGIKPGEFSLPHSIALDSKGRLYIADRNNIRVQVFDQKGKLLDVWSHVIVPWGIHISPTDEVWVCGSSPQRWEDSLPDAPLGCPPKDQIVVKFSPEGKVLGLWTFPKGIDDKEKPGELNWVHCLALDSKGNLYMGDIFGKRAQKFTLIPAGKGVKPTAVE